MCGQLRHPHSVGEFSLERHEIVVIDGDTNLLQISKYVEDWKFDLIHQGSTAPSCKLNIKLVCEVKGGSGSCSELRLFLGIGICVEGQLIAESSSG